MILLPERYDDLNLLKEEKLFINYIKNKLNNDNVLLLKIKTINEAINNIIIVPQGICFIENINIDNKDSLEIIKFIIQLHDTKIKKISNKLLTHRLFNDENNKLNINIKYKYYFTKLNIEIIDSLDDEIKEFVLENGIFKSEVTTKFKTERSIINNLLGDCEKTKIGSCILDTFIHMIAPEYTIPIYSGNVSKDIKDNNPLINHNTKDYTVSKGSLNVKVLRLDSDQINIVNKIKPGHKLLLACAGSGKSALLISKCFKIASLHEDKDSEKNKRFLLTCYNKNLNDMYNWRINIAGFRERNVDCMTFHKLCKVLLDEIGVSYIADDYEQLFDLANQKLKDGTIKKRYYGIFIDEVQIFKPEWYEFCYGLLENRNNKDYFFIICGDKSQNVSNNVKQGKAPWQGNDKLPNFRGNSIRLETNYRNTVQINSFINNFTEIAKNYATNFHIDLKEDTDSILRGNATRNGSRPRIIKTDRKDEAQNVINIIKELNRDKDIDFCDIAVLFPQKKYQPQKYYIFNWIGNKLKENDIEYSVLSSSLKENRTSYAYREGVTLCTITSALGLDFKAVIICGIKPMGAFNRSNTEKKLIDVDEEKANDFIKNINLLYTGCTRARDELVVLVSEDERKSIYSKILFEASKL